MLVMEQTAREGPCPDCGVFAGRVKDRPLVRVKDLPVSGQAVSLCWRKRRLVCADSLWPRKTPARVRHQRAECEGLQRQEPPVGQDRLYRELLLLRAGRQDRGDPLRQRADAAPRDAGRPMTADTSTTAANGKVGDLALVARVHGQLDVVAAGDDGLGDGDERLGLLPMRRTPGALQGGRIGQRGIGDVGELAVALEVPGASARRDVQGLSRGRLLVRTHGAAIANEVTSLRPRLNAVEKDRGFDLGSQLEPLTLRHRCRRRVPGCGAQVDHGIWLIFVRIGAEARLSEWIVARSSRRPACPERPCCMPARRSRAAGGTALLRRLISDRRGDLACD
jgi:hypothetical protein